MKEIFKMVDTDNSSTITFEELKIALRRFGSVLKDSEIHDLLDAVSRPLPFFFSRVDACADYIELYNTY